MMKRFKNDVYGLIWIHIFIRPSLNHLGHSAGARKAGERRFEERVLIDALVNGLHGDLASHEVEQIREMILSVLIS